MKDTLIRTYPVLHAYDESDKSKEMGLVKHTYNRYNFNRFVEEPPTGVIYVRNRQDLLILLNKWNAYNRDYKFWAD